MCSYYHFKLVLTKIRKLFDGKGEKDVFSEKSINLSNLYSCSLSTFHEPGASVKDTIMAPGHWAWLEEEVGWGGTRASSSA